MGIHLYDQHAYKLYKSIQDKIFTDSVHLYTVIIEISAESARLLVVDSNRHITCEYNKTTTVHHL